MFHRIRLYGLTLAICSLWVTGAWADEDRLEQVAELAGAGASSFALHLLDRYQPSAAQSPDVWIHWERERTLIYIQTNNWQALLGRANQRPAGLPEDFLRWQDTRVAEALLELGEVEKARTLLLGLIWRTPSFQRGDNFVRWRELVIETYLEQKQYDDAHTAWLRYRLDYAEPKPEFKALSAEVLLRLGQFSQAGAYLESPQTARERLLAAIIESELGQLSATEMWERIESLLSIGRFDPTLALEAWVALQSVAVREKDIVLGCRVLERALTLAQQRPATAQGAGISGDALWKSYEVVANAVANDHQLLVGRFEDWLTLVEEQRLSPLANRAMLAFLVLNAPEVIGDVARPLFVDKLLEEPQGSRVLQALYVGSDRAHTHGEVPEIVRYPLIELALKDAAVETAQQLSVGLGQLSQRGALIEARILLRKNPGAGSEQVMSLLRHASSLSTEDVRQFHIAINELNGILPEDTVANLLEELRAKIPSPSAAAEVQLSIAAIKMRRLEFQPAAMSYLQAAQATTNPELETQAMLQAARALSFGRMYEQAREIYSQLLNKPLQQSDRQQVVREFERLGIPP